MAENKTLGAMLQALADEGAITLVDVEAGEKKLRSMLSAMPRPSDAKELPLQLATKVRLRQVIALWELIRPKIDVSRLSFGEVQQAIEAVGIEIVNDVPRQPFAFGRKADGKGKEAQGTGGQGTEVSGA